MDGVAAAWAAWRALGEDAVLLPMQYGGAVPESAFDVTKGVFFVDICPPVAVMEELLDDAPADLWVMVLDHHKTAEADMQHEEVRHTNDNWHTAGFEAGHIYALFDMERSGAALAWWFFHRTPTPEVLLYVQDRDLWQWRMPQSREFSAGLREVMGQMSMEAFDRACFLSIGAIKETGKVVLGVEGGIVKQVVRRAVYQSVKIAGDPYFVAVAESAVLQSEIGEALLAGAACFAAIRFVDGETGTLVVSLRARKGGVDVGRIAKLYGGGGHQAAAGFSVPVALVR